jgi:hypothetical protein
MSSSKISSPGRGTIILLSTSFIPVLGPTDAATQWVTGLFLWGIKQSGRKADHLTPTSADVKNSWICTSPLRLRAILFN